MEDHNIIVIQAVLPDTAFVDIVKINSPVFV